MDMAAPRLTTGERWLLRLYVAGQSLRSLTAHANLKALCEEHLPGRYDIELVDLMEQPQLAGEEGIIALPTVVRCLPLPRCAVIGDLSDTRRALAGLQLGPSAPGAAP